MNRILKKTYQLTFGRELHKGQPDWQVAEDIINHWDVPKLGEDLAKECLFEIILHVTYPDFETTRRIVGHAEELSTELFPELANHDPHMDTIEVLERKYHEKWDNELTKERENAIGKKIR